MSLEWAYADAVTITAEPAGESPSAEVLRHDAVRRGVIEGLSTELLVALRTEIAAELDRRRGRGRGER